MLNRNVAVFNEYQYPVNQLLIHIFRLKFPALLARYFIKLSFKGNNYHGWQVQPDTVTVQGVIDKALSLILRDNISTTGAGRTDSGVHAMNFMAHFDSSLTDLHRETNLKYKLNSYLPPDICVQNIYKVSGTDHARYNALSRTYHYIVAGQKNPFLKDFSYYVYWEINMKSMNEACRLIKKQDDFTSFSKVNGNNKSSICNIIDAEWKEVIPGIMVFRITADRFLRGMVRALAGTMLDIGSGKMPPDMIHQILMEKDRSKASMAAPAEGLFFTGVKYGDDLIPDEMTESSNPFIPFHDLFF